VTGAKPPENGEQTQPMAAPLWVRAAEPGRGAGDTAAPGCGGGDTAAPGPYADVDTIDEPDAAVLAARAASWPSGDAASGDAAAPGPPGAVPVPPGAGPAAPAARTGPTLPVPAPPPGPGGSSLAWLRCEQGQGGEYLLTSHSVTVGRSPGSDIVLGEPSVSPEQARLHYDGRQWWLLPADSAGPTWVNGQPVAPGQRVPVTDGDRLRFGYHTQFRLLVPGARG
jgi:FHA domain-containing protein